MNAALRNEPSRPSDAVAAEALPPPPLCEEEEGDGGGRAAEEDENHLFGFCEIDGCDDADAGALAPSALSFVFDPSRSGAAAAASVGVTGLPLERSPTPSAPSSSSSLLASIAKEEGEGK